MVLRHSGNFYLYVNHVVFLGKTNIHRYQLFFCPKVCLILRLYNYAVSNPKVIYGQNECENCEWPCIKNATGMVAAFLRYYSRIRLEGLKKLAKKFNQNKGLSDRNSNKVRPKSK
jgi:hypothetical protein